MEESMHRFSPATSAVRSVRRPSVRSLRPYATNKDRIFNPADCPPKFSMKDLGASQTVKMVVYTAIGIIGTMETIFYCNWAWAKLFAVESVEQVDEGA